MLVLPGCGDSGGGTAERNANGKRAVVWAVGDGADGGEAARGVAERIAAKPFDRLLYLGDVYGSNFERAYGPTYGALAAKTDPTPGNHDWPDYKDQYESYWRDTRKRPVPDWYAFRAGGWEILSLNSEVSHDTGSPQERWLRGEVREPAGTCRLAFWHRPRFSASTAHHGDQPDTQPLWEPLVGHAAIVLTGHDHDMQRFKPVDGITEFVSGAGGHEHYELSEDPRVAFGNDADYGALRLELRPGRAAYTFVATDGRVLDRGIVRCRT
jgi:hypothetical protein